MSLLMLVLKQSVLSNLILVAETTSKTQTELGDNIKVDL